MVKSNIPVAENSFTVKCLLLPPNSPHSLPVYKPFCASDVHKVNWQPCRKGQSYWNDEGKKNGRASYGKWKENTWKTEQNWQQSIIQIHYNGMWEAQIKVGFVCATPVGHEAGGPASLKPNNTANVRSTEWLSFYHCCSGKAISITYSECVFVCVSVALVTQ